MSTYDLGHLVSYLGGGDSLKLLTITKKIMTIHKYKFIEVYLWHFFNKVCNDYFFISSTSELFCKYRDKTCRYLSDRIELKLPLSDAYEMIGLDFISHFQIGGGGKRCTIELIKMLNKPVSQIYDVDQAYLHFTSICYNGAVYEVTDDPKLAPHWFSYSLSVVIKSNLNDKYHVSQQFIENNYPNLRTLFEEAKNNIVRFKDKTEEDDQDKPARLLLYQILTSDVFRIHRDERSRQRIKYEDLMSELIGNDNFYFVKERYITLMTSYASFYDITLQYCCLRCDFFIVLCCKPHYLCIKYSDYMKHFIKTCIALMYSSIDPHPDEHIRGDFIEYVYHDFISSL